MKTKSRMQGCHTYLKGHDWGVFTVFPMYYLNLNHLNNILFVADHPHLVISHITHKSTFNLLFTEDVVSF